MKSRDLIVVAHSYFPWDPRIRKQVDAALDAGFSVDVVCLRGDGEAARETRDGLTIHRLPIGRDRSRGVAGYLLEYAAFGALALLAVSGLYLRHRHSVVQVHNLPDVLVLSALLPRLAGARVLLDIHDFMPELFATRYGLGADHAAIRLLRALEWLSCRFAHGVLTTHERGRRRLAQRGVPDDRITVVMNTAPMAEPRSVARAAAGDAFTIVYHGLLSDVYDLDSALHALALLQAAGESRVRLLLVGDGPRAEALEALARSLGVERRVTFEGQVPADRIPALLARADAGFAVLCDAAHQQVALPTKMFEAIAHGLPVITSRTLVIADLFSDDDVVYVPAGDATRLAEAMRRLSAEPALASERAAHAWQTLWPLRWQVMAQRYVALLRAQREQSA